MLGKDEAAEQLGKASKNTKTCSTPEQSRCADTPLSDEYAVGSPQFKRATIHLENGNDIVIEAPENGPENRYIRKMTVNGKRSSPFINYSEIKEGAKIRLEMKDNPAKFDVQKYTDR